MATGTGNGTRAVLRLLRDLPGGIRTDVPLRKLTTFRIGGPAWAVFSPRTPEALAEGVARARAAGIPWRLLGRGSNVLFPDSGFPGVVISTTGLGAISQEEGRIVAEAGAPLARIWGRGFPFLTGIPGTVGGAIAMNAGTRAGEIGPWVDWVEVLLPDGRLARLPRGECGFSYRDSRIRRLGLPILRAALVPLSSAPALSPDRACQPLSLPSAGCVFKNPRLAPAGWLIDRAGLKGLRHGDAMVSPRHANFIVNLGRARASDVVALIDRVRERVYSVFHVWLELELELVVA